jgi:hypothetical protein
MSKFAIEHNFGSSKAKSITRDSASGRRVGSGR